jgi:hypothetical protein
MPINTGMSDYCTIRIELSDIRKHCHFDMLDMVYVRKCPKIGLNSMCHFGIIAMPL